MNYPPPAAGSADEPPAGSADEADGTGGTTAAPTPRRRGPRTGRPDTRALILDAARRRFLAHGYRAVTLRSVAAEAGVDMALIGYFFGSKRGLFAAALTLAVNPAEVLERSFAGELAQVPERALRGLLAVWDDPESGPQLRLLFTGVAADPAVTALVGELVQGEMLERVAARLTGVDARRRAGAFVSQMAGLILTRFVLRLEPVTSMSADEIVRFYAPPLRTALLPARPPARLPAARPPRRPAR